MAFGRRHVGVLLIMALMLALGSASSADAYVSWGNAGSSGLIGRANLDGSAVNQNFISGANSVPGVAVASASAGIPFVFTDLSSGGAYLATAINNNGDIVGSAVSGGYQKGFVRRNGVVTILDYMAPLAGGSYASRTPYSYARDINDNGVVVGTSSDGLDGRYNGGHHAVVWRPFDTGNPSTTPFDVGALEYGGHDCNYGSNTSIILDCYTQGVGINKDDDIAGYGEFLENPNGYPYCWCAFPFTVPLGNRMVLSSTGDAPSADVFVYDHNTQSYEATGINDFDKVVVWPDPATPTNSNSSALYPGDVPIPFESSIHQSVYQPINNTGWVVGTDRSLAHPHGKVWEGGAVVDLPPLAGDDSSNANGINDKGDIVGKSSLSSGGCWKAVEWPHGDYAHPIDLNTKISGTWQLWDAYGINEKGQIIGAGRSDKTCPNAVTFKPYLVTPPPALSIADADAAEPETGTVDMTFTVTLGLTVSTPVTVDYATSDGTGNYGAVAGQDYTETHGTLTFNPGDTSKTITVPVKANGFQADRTFFVDLSNAGSIDIDDGHAIGTIHGRGPLEVTVSPTPAKVDVQQNADGPVTQDVTVDLAIKNRGKSQINTVTVPDKLVLGWDFPAPIIGFPITQTAPAEADRTFGPIPAGQTKHATYTLHVTGDGKFTLDALVLGDADGQTVKGFGTAKLEADSQLLYYTGTQGAKVNSQTKPGLIKAGTTFLINITLENRSVYRTIVVNPIYPDFEGSNAHDGHVQERDVGSTAAAPTGSQAEVVPSKYLVLTPGQKREFVSVVRTTASDAFEDTPEGAAPKGGTRAIAKFKAPVIRVVTDQHELLDVAADRVAMKNGSTDFQLGVDDSVPDPPPFSYPEAVWYVGKGSIFGLWRLTWGTARGLFWDLPGAAIGGVISVSAGTLNAIDRTVELWTATENDPVLRQQYINAVADKILSVYEEAPYAIALAPNKIFNAASDAVGANMTKLSKEWYAGDWRPALTEFTAEGTETVGQVAMLLSPGILARFPAVAAKWEAVTGAVYAKVSSKLAPVLKRVTAVKSAVAALSRTVKPGYTFGAKQMAKLYGVSAKEAEKLAAFVARRKISIVLRSRAQESIDFLEKGLAVVKPYWIKTKNVSFVDAEYLGYHAEDIGKVVLRKPLAKARVEANLAKKGIKKGTPQYKDALDRWSTRVDEYHGEYKQMQKWNKNGKVKGKWPWEENGVDPRVQADEYSSVHFKLFPDGKGQLIPKVYVKGKGWKFITGDIDLIAITKADGSALSDLEHVGILQELKGIIGAQHPESATWVKKGQFWFKAKKGYLTNEGECCLAQFGPDGKIRAVEFDEKLSEPDKWTKLNYRIRWKGGYQVGSGQK